MRANIRRHSNLLVVFGVIAFGVIGGGVVFNTVNGESAASITQESSQRLDFTFEPTVQITLSSSTLLVSDLALNTYSDSNTIDILAGTNVSAGMQLTATVGSVNNPTSNLVQTGTTDVFSSIATDANLANLGEAEGTNIWGYSYKNSNTETWGNYNGLPTYDATGALLLNTSDVTNSTINFKIAAKAGGTQALGSYTNSINFSAVAKVITTNYAINFLNDGNDVTNWPTNVSGSDTTGQGTTVTLSSLVPDKVGYDFAGWCTVSTNDGSCTGNVYQPGDSYPIGAVGDTVTVNLYAMWEPLVVTFKVGTGIETIIVARNDNSVNKPYYASSSRDIKFDNPAVGTEYTVTVVPSPNYKLGSWTTSATPNTGLASQTLLTTTYTVTGSETLTANGVSGSYDAMKDLTLANCSISGTNVTDARNGRSYTVKKLVSDSISFCFMLSNLRLDGGTELNSSDSNVSSTYILPTENWTSNNQDYYCKAIMKHYDQLNGSEYRNEYYYNWYAATANPTQCPEPTSSTNATETNDNNSLGDICPKDWALPTDSNGSLQINNSTFRTTLLNTKSLTTSGSFYLGSQKDVGGTGIWWSSTRISNASAYELYLRDGGANRANYFKYSGFSVRCMRSS